MNDSCGYAERIEAEAGAIGSEAARLLLELRPGLAAGLAGPRMRAAEEDLAHHARYLAAYSCPGLDPGLEDYLQWCKALYDALGFPDEVIVLSFRCAARAAARRIEGPDAERLLETAERAAFAYPRCAPAASRYADSFAPKGSLAAAYVQALVSGRRDLATSLVRAEVERGTEPRAMYLGLFQPAQREIGKLWMARSISVAQEHFATAATQAIMAGLYPLLFSRAPEDGRLVLVACAQGELHELGARMVADLFQAEGWDSRFLGANLPVRELATEAARSRPALIALSATVAPSLPWIGRAVAAVKSAFGEGSSPPIIVGGLAFAAAPELWRGTGADGYSVDCERAVELGRRLAETGSGGAA